MTKVEGLEQDIRACRLCAERFAATATGHRPRPVTWFRSSARILIAGQAPGRASMKVANPLPIPRAIVCATGWA